MSVIKLREGFLTVSEYCPDRNSVFLEERSRVSRADAWGWLGSNSGILNIERKGMEKLVEVCGNDGKGETPGCILPKKKPLIKMTLELVYE